MVKLTQTIRNCLSLFDHSVGVGLKGLNNPKWVEDVPERLM